MLTAQQVAEQWQCTPEHVQRLAKRGLLSGLRLGGKAWRFTPEAVARFEAAHTTVPADPERAVTLATSPASRPAVEIGGDYEPVVSGPVPWRTSVLSAVSPAAARGRSTHNTKKRLSARN